jgi:hypothetical protein
MTLLRTRTVVPVRFRDCPLSLSMLLVSLFSSVPTSRLDEALAPLKSTLTWMTARAPRVPARSGEVMVFYMFFSRQAWSRAAIPGVL